MSFRSDIKPGNRKRRLISAFPQLIARGIVELVTLPYHRFFLFNTLKPLQQIEKQITEREKLSVIFATLAKWRARKVRELEFISIACVTLTAIVISSLSWNTIADAHWTAAGLFYASLTFSIIGILLAAQQVTVLTLLGALPEDSETTEPAVASKVILRHLPQMLSRLPAKPLDIESRNNEHDLGTWTLRWKMVFIWQIPMMFMGYSFLCYIIGLTVLTSTPLIQSQPWGPASNIAIAYLAVFGVAWAIFIYCSLMGYDPIDLDTENETTSSNVYVSEVQNVALKTSGKCT